MGDIQDRFASVFRDFVVQGVPASGPHEPVKAEIRALGAAIERLFGAALGAVTVAKATKADLDADLAYPAGKLALVYTDPVDANNDIYVKSGASGTGNWTNTGALHSIVASLTADFVDDLNLVPPLTAAMALGIPFTTPRLVPTAGSVNPSVLRTYTPVVDKSYTLMARFQRGGIRYVQLLNSSAADAAGVSAIFDCVNNTIVTAVGTAEWVDLGGDWVEFRVTSGTVASAVTGSFQVRLTQSGTFPYTSNGTDAKSISAFELREAGTLTNLFPSRDVRDASFTKINVTASEGASYAQPLSASVAGTAATATALNTLVKGAPIATRAIESAGTTNSRLYRSMTYANGSTYQQTVVAKAGARKWLRIISNAAALWDFTVNLETGEYFRSANLAYADAQISVVYDVNGYWRIAVSAVSGANGGANSQIIILDDTFVWPNRTGDGVSGFALRSAEMKKDGATLWLSTSFAGDANWTADGLTLTDNAEVYGNALADLKPQPGLVGVGGRAYTTLPNGGDGLFGTGPVFLKGYRHFIPRQDTPDLNRAFRAAFAYEIAKGIPLVWMGDSITWDTAEINRKHNYLDMICSHVNQGSPADEPLLHAVADYLLPNHGIAITGPRSNGTSGPLGENLIMQPTCVLTFTGAYEQLGFFFDRAVGAGTLTIAYNGTTITTVNTAGAAELDRYSGAIATGQAASGTYTVTCSGGNVALTGIDRLGVKAAGSLARVRFVRWAHGSYNFSHFNATTIASMLKQVSAFTPLPPPVTIAVGINERQAVGTTGYDTMKTRMQASIDALQAAGVTRIVGQMPLRTSAAADAGFYASALPYDQLIGGMQEVYWSESIPIIGTHALDLAPAGKMDADGIHPAESGLVDVAYTAITGLCRARGVI